jgi:PAS domain-containing protein
MTMPRMTGSGDAGSSARRIPYVLGVIFIVLAVGIIIALTKTGLPVVLVGVLLLAAGAGIGLLWRHQSARFYREKAEAAEVLRESQEKSRTLFQTMAQGVVFQDADGKIVSANPAAERILGLSLDQLQGRTSVDPRWRAIHEDGSDFPGETPVHGRPQDRHGSA